MNILEQNGSCCWNAKYLHVNYWKAEIKLIFFKRERSKMFKAHTNMCLLGNERYWSKLTFFLNKQNPRCNTLLSERRFFLHSPLVRSFHCLSTALSGGGGKYFTFSLLTSFPPSSAITSPPSSIIGSLLFLVFLPLSNAAIITTCPDHFASPGRPSLSSLHSQQLCHGFLVILISGFLKSRFVGFQSYHFALPSHPSLSGFHPQLLCHGFLMVLKYDFLKSRSSIAPMCLTNVFIALPAFRRCSLPLLPVTMRRRVFYVCLLPPIFPSPSSVYVTTWVFYCGFFNFPYIFIYLVFCSSFCCLLCVCFMSYCLHDLNCFDLTAETFVVGFGLIPLFFQSLYRTMTMLIRLLHLSVGCFRFLVTRWHNHGSPCDFFFFHFKIWN